MGEREIWEGGRNLLAEIAVSRTTISAVSVAVVVANISNSDVAVWSSFTVEERSPDYSIIESVSN